jgi:hypothetical protein
LIGRGDDDDGAGHAGFAKVFLNELAQFATAFADERDHVDVRIGASGHHAEEGGFADAAASEDANALAAADWREEIEDLDAGLEGLVNADAAKGIGRGIAERLGEFGAERAAIVEGLAEAIDDAADEAWADWHGGLVRGGDDVAAGGDVVELAEGHEQNAVIAEADDFRVAAMGGAVKADLADLADANAGAIGLDDEAGDLGDASDALDVMGIAQAGADLLDERLEK